MEEYNKKWAELDRLEANPQLRDLCIEAKRLLNRATEAQLEAARQYMAKWTEPNIMQVDLRQRKKKG
jgi:hypothetical protein